MRQPFIIPAACHVKQQLHLRGSNIEHRSLKLMNEHGGLALRRSNLVPNEGSARPSRASGRLSRSWLDRVRPARVQGPQPTWALRLYLHEAATLRPWEGYSTTHEQAEICL